MVPTNAAIGQEPTRDRIAKLRAARLAANVVCEDCGYVHLLCLNHRKDGDPCASDPSPGLDVCWRHGGKSKKGRLIIANTKAEIELEKLRAEDHKNKGQKTGGYLLRIAEDISAMDQLYLEIRRCAGHIAYLEDRIDSMPFDELIWGLTREEAKSDFSSSHGDRSYSLTVEGAAFSKVLELYHNERDRLIYVCKVAVTLGLDERKVRMQEELVSQLNGAITNILLSLGLDPHDPDVRHRVRTELVALDPATVIEGEIVKNTQRADSYLPKAPRGQDVAAPQPRTSTIGVIER